MRRRYDRYAKRNAKLFDVTGKPLRPLRQRVLKNVGFDVTVACGKQRYVKRYDKPALAGRRQRAAVPASSLAWKSIPEATRLDVTGADLGRRARSGERFSPVGPEVEQGFGDSCSAKTPRRWVHFRTGTHRDSWDTAFKRRLHQ